MNTATLSSKFQVCIPKEIREQLHLKAGQKLVFIAKGNTLHLVPVRSLAEVRGILGGVNTEDYRDRKDRV